MEKNERPHARPENIRVAKPNTKSRNRKKAILLCVWIGLAIVAMLIAAVMMFGQYKPTFTEEAPVIVTDAQGNVVEDIQRDQKHVNVLILGKDRWAFNTDVMMIASFDESTGKVCLMQIPRDTYIDIGRGNLKANSLLASYYSTAVKEGADDPMRTALEAYEKQLEEIFCITIDYYAMMDLNGFVNIVDAIGGVKINVKSRMQYSDPIQNLKINLYPGEQVLSGDQAEQFVRFRHGYLEGDIGRVDAQKQFMAAFLESAKNNLNLSTIASTIEQVNKYLITDIPLADMLYYGKQAFSIDPANMTMMTIPGVQCRQYDDSGTWYYVVFRNATIEYLNEFYNSYNFSITNDMFDQKGALYDVKGSYMYSLFVSMQEGDGAYTADEADDIKVYLYGNGGGSGGGGKSTKKTETEAAPEETDELSPDIIQTTAPDGLETLEPVQTEDENGSTEPSETQAQQGEDEEPTPQTAAPEPDDAPDEAPKDTPKDTPKDAPVEKPDEE